MTMVNQKSEETRTLTGFHGGLRRGAAAAALGAVLVLSAGVPASNALSLVPVPDASTQSPDAVTVTPVAQTDVPLLGTWVSVVLGPKPDPTGSPAPGSDRPGRGTPTPPGLQRPTPSTTPTTEPSPALTPTPTPSEGTQPPSEGTQPPSATPAPSPTGEAVPPSEGPTQAPETPAPAPAGTAPAVTPAAPPAGALPISPAPASTGANVAGATVPGSTQDGATPGGASGLPSGAVQAVPASAWGTVQVFGPANVATLTSAGTVPLSGPGYGVSSAPVMRSAVSVTPVGAVSPLVWWGSGLVALACAAGVAFVRMRRI
jgi:hypothetical protein